MAEGLQSRVGAIASRELRIANQIEEIERVAALVDEFGEQNRISNEILVAVNVSLDEVINNIISYGYEDSGHHDIVVRLSLLKGASVEVIVEDDGKPFNPLSVPAPDLRVKPRQIGGVGLHFVRKLMDHLEYARCGEINQLRLTKSIKE
ncbi:MAG: ATP-binding protein [Xanthobacteraceae bacterium]